ncbi:uncharacterized protein LOC130821370 isoform X1 [Amaranthus tricolor]|uniref:uncharacterized protein LOC130821370 isoform X1 n=1 Tax=Amaranthus tricolor TaxID=29722 RepID=UPI00258C9F04|nr:uncharacterized protein LOC130821370 isoform X1 [Amaranthus tricolor]
MMLVFVRRIAASTSIVVPLNPSVYFHSKFSYPFSRSSIDNSDPLTLADNGCGSKSHLGGILALPSLCEDRPQLNSHEIKVVDLDTWSVSSGLSRCSMTKPRDSQLRLFGVEEVENELITSKEVMNDSDLYDVEDMRIHKDLFYKIEKGSIEFEEYQFDFHGRKSKSSANGGRECKKESLKCDFDQKDENILKDKGKGKEVKVGALVNKERLARSIEEKYVMCTPQDLDDASAMKKKRNPTFNQLTGPYHEPFCLDIHVSKGSVRACIVHRVTSKVVVVAHSISKDIKFNLGSTKSRVAATTIGKVLAHRALADDIHDVIYTPRKGDKLEGKLQLVLQAVIDNGINVKVRLKQRIRNKVVRRSPADEE